jgi:hypothetical protein
LRAYRARRRRLGFGRYDDLDEILVGKAPKTILPLEAQKIIARLDGVEDENEGVAYEAPRIVGYALLQAFLPEISPARTLEWHFEPSPFYRRYRS